MSRKLIIIIIVVFSASTTIISFFQNKENIDLKAMTAIVSNKIIPSETRPVQLKSPPGNLKIPLIPFVYNSLYSIEDIKDPNHAIQVLSDFQYLVCAEPGHLTTQEIQVANTLKSKVKIFGYVNMGGTPLPHLSKIQKEIDNIHAHGWYGVFIDQFGFDYGETRERQNIIVDYAHSKGLKCFANSWFVDDAFGNSVDQKHNPKGLPTALGKDDWYLIESFIVSNSGYNEDIDALLLKCKKAQLYKDKLQINIATLSYKRDAALWETSSPDITNSYLISLLMGFDGWWFTDMLESDSFKHGKPSDLDVGNSLNGVLTKFSSGHYVSKTDKYVLLFNMIDYPSLRLEAFTSDARDKNLKKYISNK